MEEASLGPRPAPQPVGVRARTRDVARRYGLALLAPLAALLLRLGLTPWLGAHDRLLLLYLSLVVSAWYGGFGPGVVSTIFGALLADHFLVAPRYLFFPARRRAASSSSSSLAWGFW